MVAGLQTTARGARSMLRAGPSFFIRDVLRTGPGRRPLGCFLPGLFLKCGQAFDCGLVSSNLLYESLEYVARPDLHEIASSVSQHVLHCLGPLHRRGQLCKKVLLDSVRVSGRESGDILVDRAYRCLECRCLELRRPLDP